MRARGRDRARPAPEVAIAHRDAHLLVLVKPPGLPTTAPDDVTPCLARVARELDPDAPKMHASSRLDRDVTGLVTFARTERAIEALLEARRAGRYDRTYLAITSAVPEASEGRWTWGIAIDPRDPTLRIALREGETGERAQDASTRWTRRAIASGCAALALHPETGRTHQLRVHCAAAKVPILGDTSYGGAPRAVLGDGRVVSARRVMLHCARLVLPDVARGGDAMLTLERPPPDDFARAWQALGGEPSAILPRV